MKRTLLLLGLTITGITTTGLVYTQKKATAPKYRIELGQEFTCDIQSATTFFNEQLNHIMHDISELGITKANINEKITSVASKFKEAEKSFINQGCKLNPLSPQTLNLANELLANNNLKDRVTVVPWNAGDITAAGALVNVLAINEPVLSTLESLAQEFVLSHELIHIHNQDSLMFDAVDQLLADHNIAASTAENIRCRLTHLFEMRADCLAVIKNPQLIDGMISYLEQGIREVGVKPQRDGYPTLDQRLAYTRWLKKCI